MPDDVGIRYRLVFPDGVTYDQQDDIWEKFFASDGKMEYWSQHSDGWKSLSPSDEEATNLDVEEVLELGKAAGMPVYWWGCILGAGGRPHTLAQVEQAAEGLELELLWEEPVRPGDMYLAARNTGAHLLECKQVSHQGWVVPTCNGYPYNWNECVKVQ